MSGVAAFSRFVKKKKAKKQRDVRCCTFFQSRPRGLIPILETPGVGNSFFEFSAMSYAVNVHVF
jgi:hypothetical protein